MGGLPGQKTKEKTIEALLLDNYDQYYRLAYSYVHNESDACDIVQNAAYKAIKNSKSLKQRRYAATWLYRIVVNEIFTCLKQRKHEPLDAVEEPRAEDDYEDIDLAQALGRLPDEDAMIVKLKYFEEMKLEEIAMILDENVNTVKSRLYRSLRKLKVIIEEDWMYQEEGNCGAFLKTASDAPSPGFGKRHLN